MISGIRNAPPISTSSPRDTITSRPLASVFRASSTAAALLFTTVAASAPVRCLTRSSMACSRRPRSPWTRSVLEVHRLRGRAQHRVACRLREQRASKVGVQHGARGVDDALEPRVPGVEESGLEPRDDRFDADRFRVERMALANRASQFIEQVAACLHHVFTIESNQQTLGSWVSEESAHGGQFSERVVSHAGRGWHRRNGKVKTKCESKVQKCAKVHDRESEVAEFPRPKAESLAPCADPSEC